MVAEQTRSELNAPGLAVAVVVMLLAAAACTATSGAAPRDSAPSAFAPFSFAVMGDTPYAGEEERLFPRMATEISSADVAFVVHVGDIKGGGNQCTDSLIASRFSDLDRIAHPLVYVPGDNEWTDCHRVPAGVDAPLERLAHLRSVFYPIPGRSLGRPAMIVESQALGAFPEFPEHQRWIWGGVVFATVHVVGSRNGLEPFPSRTVADDAEVERRILAALAWLRGTFAMARADRSTAVVVAMQANPWGVPDGIVGRTGFEEILSALREESAAFGGPVLFVHGDTHVMRFDRPFASGEGAAPELLRLETFGAPDVGWVQVHVDPTSAAVFGVTPRRVLPP